MVYRQQPLSEPKRHHCANCKRDYWCQSTNICKFNDGETTPYCNKCFDWTMMFSQDWENTRRINPF